MLQSEALTYFTKKLSAKSNKLVEDPDEIGSIRKEGSSRRFLFNSKRKVSSGFV